MRSFAPGFIFTTALPPAVAAAATASVRHLKRSAAERDLQHRQAAKVKAALARAGLPVLESETHIVPVMVCEPEACKAATDRLLEKHAIYIQPINYPTVPRGLERLRITPGPLHTDAHIRDLTTALVEVWTALGPAARRAGDGGGVAASKGGPAGSDGLLGAALAGVVEELVVGLLGQLDLDPGEEVAGAVLARQALAAQAEDAPQLVIGGIAMSTAPVSVGTRTLAAEHRLLERHRHRDAQVLALGREALVRADADGQERVAGLAAVASPKPAQPDHLAVGDPLRDDDVDLAPVREGDALLRLAGDVLEGDVERRRDVLAARPRRLAGGAGALAEGLAEELREDVVAAAGAPAPAAAGTGAEAEAEALEVALVAAARPAREALEALEARLAVGVDLAAVELGALAGVAEDLVGRVQLGEAVLRLRIGGVAVG